MKYDLLLHIKINMFSVYDSLPKVDVTTSSPLQNILKIIWVVIGAVSVLIISLAGLRLVISNGDPQAMSKARNTIIYAAIGLLVSISAFTIVQFVGGRL